MKCSNCGCLFKGNRRRAYCDNCTPLNKTRNLARSIQREKHEIDFVAIDGEGVLRPNGTHDYILLSAGSSSLYGASSERLTFPTIMEFLWSTFCDNPTATYCGFYLGYDFTNWLKDLPEDRARMLLTKEGIALRSRTNSGENRIPFPVRYAGWEFDMLGMKRFKLRAMGEKSWMYICDTGAFFQTSFLNVINPKAWPEPIVTDEEFELIKQGKEERGAIVDFGQPVDEDMIKYNVLENDILGRVMNRYNEGLVNIGVKLNRKQWFGPGQVAQEWMNNNDVPTREDHSMAIDPFIMEAGRSSYYGGWFEIFAHGHIPGTSYLYDINSAYPYAMASLPCLIHGSWEVHTPPIGDWNNPDILCLVYGTISGSNQWIGSMPFRTKQGRILRPQRTKGWYWAHEIRLAKECGLTDEINVEGIVTYKSCNCSPPFAGLRDLYNHRLRMGKNTPEGKASKLTYNSAYGKCAQSIGMAKYANPIYASLVTSACRSMILSAIGSHPNGANDVLMIATDGIAFKTKHPSLDLSEEELGKWSASKSENLTLFMPGMYWDDETRRRLRLQEDPVLKSRGVSAVSLSNQIHELDELFSGGEYFPTTQLHINFNMVSPIQALARNKWETAGLVTLSDTRNIDANPGQKRYPNKVIKDRGMIRTIPYEEGPVLESTPYEKRFGLEMNELKDMEAMGPDGDIMMLFAHALGLR